MLHIHFTAETPSDELEESAEEYRNVWNQDGERIMKAFQDITGFTFSEDTVEAIVYEGMSFSGKDENSPMRLRASYPIETKRATLIHELGHRILFQVRDYGDYDEHQVLYLFLYDVWTDLYGAFFADEQVGVESARKGFYDYEKTWKWALQMSREERKELLVHTL